MNDWPGHWLLDTNILSELWRPKPEPRALDFIARQALDLLFIDTIALAGIRCDIVRISDPGRRAELNTWLTHKVWPIFDQRVLPVSDDMMFEWRLLAEDGRKAGHTLSQLDLIIAAIALDYGLMLVSKARVASFNPWSM